jgi:hypothetical protein
MHLEYVHLAEVNHQSIINYHSTSPTLLDKEEH